MDSPEKSPPEDLGTTRAGHGNHFIRLMWICAFAGVLFILFFWLKPHKTATVYQVGSIGHNTARHGVGIHASKRTVYASDVRAVIGDRLIADTALSKIVNPMGNSQEKITVYYRVSDPSRIPKEGDRIQVCYSRLIDGYVPYPETWGLAVGTILLILGAGMLVCSGVYRIASSRKRPRG